MPHRNAPEEDPTTKEEPATPERFRSATAAIRRVLEGSISLDEWEAAFSQVSGLTRRAVNGESDEIAAMVAARGEYHAALREWHQHLPGLQGWLVAEKNRLESRLAHGTGVRSWLGAHGQTR
jgi:homoserine kinase